MGQLEGGREVELGGVQREVGAVRGQQPQPLGIDVEASIGSWQEGSVVRSWLLELAAEALTENPKLDGVSGFVEDSGEGRWTVQQAVESGVAAPVITLLSLGLLGLCWFWPHPPIDRD